MSNLENAHPLHTPNIDFNLTSQLFLTQLTTQVWPSSVPACCGYCAIIESAKYCNYCPILKVLNYNRYGTKLN